MQTDDDLKPPEGITEPVKLVSAIRDLVKENPTATDEELVEMLGERGVDLSKSMEGPIDGSGDEEVGDLPSRDEPEESGPHGVEALGEPMDVGEIADDLFTKGFKNYKAPKKGHNPIDY